MTGQIRKTGNNKWFVRISAGKHPISGKRIQKSLVVYGSRRDAEKALHDLRGQEYAGSLVSSNAILDEIVALWLNAPTKGGRKRAASTTYHDQKRYERYIQPTLGKARVSHTKTRNRLSAYIRETWCDLRPQSRNREV